MCASDTTNCQLAEMESKVDGVTSEIPLDVVQDLVQLRSHILILYLATQR